MSNQFYLRLAVTNIRKNGKTYFPFIVAAMGNVAMFYIAHFMSVDPAVAQAADSGTVIFILSLAIWIVAIFSGIFLFYTNSFLIKRRKKEFGLFNILGMEKKHIARVLGTETLIISAISLAGGLVLGISFSKLMLVLLFRMLKYLVPMGFSVSGSSVLYTLLLYGGIFIGILLWNVAQIHLSRPIELLQGGNVGEREPKTRWFSALVGAITVGIGYYIALTTQSPLRAIPLFFVAVILVIIGTYFLFSAGSILLLKQLRKNKKYYYQPGHFYSISGMIYRMKQNAVGLANICILSVGVMVMLSTTLSLYMGGDDVIRGRFPADVTISIYPKAPMEYDEIITLMEKELEGAGIVPRQAESYSVTLLEAVQRDGSFMAESAQNPLMDGYVINAITQEEYSRLTGDKPSLKPGELLYYNEHDNSPKDTVTIFGNIFAVKGQMESSPIDKNRMMGVVNRCIIVTDSMDTNMMLLEQARMGTGTLDSELYFQCSFDTDSSIDREEEIAFVVSLRDKLWAMGDKLGFGAYIDSVEKARDGFFSLYGGLLFLGMFTGTLFIVATVLIIYYKQVSEGYDDRERFQIMQKVGMDKWEVKNTIRSQVLTVFMLPIAVAVLHLLVAFPVLTKLLAVLNLHNVPLFAAWTVATVLVFVVFYTVVYALTAKTYYKIVE
ncbi:MAG: ABC transporter permease [Angelakisella sp.]